MKYFETEKRIVDLRNINFEGRILDIGGGGEGIISRHSGDSVVAIDKRPDELAETPDIGLKIIMDACSLKFLDGYFDTITCFYTLMYMSLQEIEQFFCEAYRVLKKGGRLWIWDTVIPAVSTADIFIAQLEVNISEHSKITVGYGARWNREHSCGVLEPLFEKAGFTVRNMDEGNDAFNLALLKSGGNRP